LNLGQAEYSCILSQIKWYNFLGKVRLDLQTSFKIIQSLKEIQLQWLKIELDHNPPPPSKMLETISPANDILVQVAHAGMLILWIAQADEALGLLIVFCLLFLNTHISFHNHWCKMWLNFLSDILRYQNT